MFVGHYGPSFAIKAIRPAIPIGPVFIAVQLVDLVWAVLVLLGIEKVRIVPGVEMRQCGASSIFLSLFVLVAGCATSSDPVADYHMHSRTRGYIDSQVAKGLFQVSAKGNHGLFVSGPESAREVWANRAAALCGTSEYKELSVREYFVQNAVGPESMIIAKQPYKDGYVLCKGAEISEAEALTLLPKRQ